jgi:hypothetical protein
MVITSAGLVGIGTTTPSKKLHVSTTSSTAYNSTDFDQDYLALRLTNTTDDKAVGMLFNVGTNGDAAITAIETGDGETAFAFGTRIGGVRGEKMRLTAGGLLGLGTSAPGTALHIVASTTGGPLLRLTDNSGVGGGGRGSALDLQGTSNDTGSVATTFARILGLKTNNTQGNTQGFFQISTDNGSGQQTALTIDSSQRVGIGTSSPSVPLHVLTNTVGVAEILRLRNSDTSYGQGVAIELQGFYPHARISTQGNPAATPGGDVRLQTYNSSTGSLVTGVILNNAGNVGIGTTSPSRTLDVVGTGIYTAFTGNTGATFNIVPAANGQDGVSLIQSYVDGTGYGPIKFEIDGEKMRLDSSGRLLVGTSTAPSVGDGQYAKLVVQSNTSGGGAGVINLQSSFASNAMTVDSNIGWLQFTGNDGARFASIQSFADGTSGTNDYPGRLVFSTTADGSASSTEAMRINNQQELLIGTSTRNANGGVLQLKSGITFPATAVAATDANTLDDYEEGTWTPNQGGGFTITGTFSSSGTYTKVGRLVTVTAKYEASTSLVVAPGQSQLSTNLPFQSQVSVGNVTNNGLTIAEGCACSVAVLYYTGNAIVATPVVYAAITYVIS